MSAMLVTLSLALICLWVWRLREGGAREGSACSSGDVGGGGAANHQGDPHRRQELVPRQRVRHGHGDLSPGLAVAHVDEHQARRLLRFFGCREKREEEEEEEEEEEGCASLSVSVCARARVSREGHAPLRLSKD
jgi:hypothetical protein